MNRLLALTKSYPPLQGLGPLGTGICDPVTGICDIITATTKFENALSVAIGVMTVVAGIWFIFSLMTSAIQWLSAGSDKQAIQNAQKKIGNSIVGLFITVASYLIIVIIGRIVGLDVLNPALIIVTQLIP